MGAVRGPAVTLGTCTTGSFGWVWHLGVVFSGRLTLPELGLIPLRSHLWIGMCKTSCQQHHHVAERSNDSDQGLIQALFTFVHEIGTLWELVDGTGG